MKTLDEIKDEVAKENGFVNWDNLCFVWAGFMKQTERFMDIVAKRYAKEALYDAAENATASVVYVDPYDYSKGIEGAEVDKESITNTEIKL